MDGVIVVNKEKGWTSHDVVAKLRGVLGQKKIGHTGTLDPDATGVLPILLGKATKLSDILTAEEKIYLATFKLGVETTTLDMSGEVISEVAVTEAKAHEPTNEKSLHFSNEEIQEAVNSFIGEIDQVPPMYSAIKVDGKKLYELAREGKEIERKSRRVTISEIEIMDIKLPFVTMKVHCSKGTYIRSLCDDIGKKLGTHAAMSELERLRSGDFQIEGAFAIEEIEKLAREGEIEKNVLSIENVLSYMPKFVVDKAHSAALLNGNILETSWGCGEIEAEGTLVYSDNDRLIGIYKVTSNGKLKPHKMLA